MAANITVNGGAAGVGILNAAVGAPITLLDVGGGSPASRTWTIEYWPSPLATPPTVTTPTLISAGFTPALDGIYQVKLLRLEADNVTTTTQSVLVCVVDAYGNVLPSPGVDEHLFAQFGANPTAQAAARRAGWFGSAAGGTDVFLSAYLRGLSTRVGGVGAPMAGDVTGTVGANVVAKVNGTVAPPTALLADVGKAFGVTAAGVAGWITVATDLSHATSNLGFTTGADATIDVTDNHKLLIGGASTTTEVDIGHGTIPIALVGAPTINGQKVMLLPQMTPYPGIVGLQQTPLTTPDARGTILFDPSVLFAGNAQITRTIVFRAALECALGGGQQTCSLELYNDTDSVSVVTLTTTNPTTTDVVSATLSIGAGAGNIPNGRRRYKCRLTRTGGGQNDLVSCTLAQLEVAYN